jgi:hypothetical protein
MVGFSLNFKDKYQTIKPGSRSETSGLEKKVLAIFPYSYRSDAKA